jgi:hypothetical protein
MAAPSPAVPGYSPGGGPAWASWLGVVAIVLGIFVTAVHGNEWMKQGVITGAMPAGGEMPPADCPPEELEEEGLSLAECEFMVENVRGIALSAPAWFPRYQMAVSAAGTVLGFLSILCGAALVNYRAWAPMAAAASFAALALVDMLAFAGVVNAGPLVRQAYLGNILLWFVIHFMMTVGAIAGRHEEQAR